MIIQKILPHNKTKYHNKKTRYKYIPRIKIMEI